MPGENDFSFGNFADSVNNSIGMGAWQNDQYQPMLQGFGDAAGYQGDLFGEEQPFTSYGVNEGGETSWQSSARDLNPDFMSAMKGYSFRPTGPQSLGMFKGNNLLSNQTYGSKDTFWDKVLNTTIPMALTAGAGGGLAGIFGGGMLGGAAGYGLANAGMADFQGGDAQKAFLSGAISGGMSGLPSGSSPASLVGIQDKSLGNIFNRGASSTIGSLATGSNLQDSLTKGLTSSAIGAGNALGQNGMSFVKNLFGSFAPQDTEFANLMGSGGDMSEQTDVTPNRYDETTTGSDGLTTYNPSYTYGGDQSNALPQQQIQSVSSSVLPSLVSNALSGVGKYAVNNAGDLASMLYGFYNNRKQQQALGSQISSLQGLYGQNSPYAQQLRATLAAKAAAQGKRSNIAGRETQLQAALADRYAQLQPSMLQMNQARGQLQNNNMNLLLQGARNMGVFNGLGSMFNNSPYSNYSMSNNTGNYNLLGTDHL